MAATVGNDSSWSIRSKSNQKGHSVLLHTYVTKPPLQALGDDTVTGNKQIKNSLNQ
jgi:hypothetical protein